MTDFPVPRGVPTSMTLHELRLLQKYAAVAGTVLEIGALYGFSAIGMALASAHVTSVDPHTNGVFGEGDTWEAFLDNVDRHGVPFYVPDLVTEECDFRVFLPGSAGSITGLRRPIEIEVPGQAYHGRFGMAFVDGDHGDQAPLRDARIALAHLRQPGYLAFHDMRPNFPAVLRATELLEREGAIHRLEQAGGLVVYQARLT